MYNRSQNSRTLSVADNYFENNKQFETAIHGPKPSDFSFSFSNWPQAFGSLVLRITGAESGQAGTVMRPLTQKIMRIKGLFPTIKIGENTTLFVILEFSMFAFLGRKVQYILSLIVLKIRKNRFSEKRGPNQIFQILIFIRKSSLPSFGSKTVTL